MRDPLDTSRPDDRRYPDDDAWIDAIMATAESQPPDVRDRILLAFNSGLLDVVARTREELVVSVRGIGQLTIRRTPLPPRRADA